MEMSAAGPGVASLGRRALAEALGTATLVLIGPGAAMVAAATHAFGHAGVALAFGLAVALVVSACGRVSGAHVNPAVTLAFWSAGRFPARDVVPYVAAQCVGAVAAALALRWLLGPVGGLGATVPALPLGRAFAVEAGYSAILAFVIFAVATDPEVPRSVPPVALGAAVAAGALVAGPLTGGSFNPARTLGPAVAGGGFAAHWLYWVAPVGGMILGAHAYEFLRPRPAAAAPLGVEGPL